MFKKVVKSIFGLGNILKIKNIIDPFKIEEIIIDISASCNAQCPFCPRMFMPKERSKGFMSLELFEQILNDAKEYGIYKLRLYSTAEPTMHPKFDQIVNIAKEKGFEISLSTNASLLDKHMDSLMKIDFLQYSIEGWDEDSYEKYRYPLKFNKTYENVKQFHEYALVKGKIPKISINLLITKKTDIKKYIQLWGNFVHGINIHFMYNPVKYENDRFVSMDISVGEDYYILDKQTKNFYCNYPFNIITVSFDGKLALCCDDFVAELGLGNIQDGIKNYLKSNKLNQVKKQFYSQSLDICKDCSRFSVPRREDVLSIKGLIRELDDVSKSKLIFDY